MKTIFTTASCGILARNILRTDVLKILRSIKDLRIVILSPAFQEEDFIKEFQGPNVVLEKLCDYRPGKLETLLVGARRLFALGKLDTLKIKRERERRIDKKYFSYLLKEIGSNFGNKYLRKFLEKIDIAFFSGKDNKQLFEKYRPCLVFATHLDGPNTNILKGAKKNKVFTISMPLSWDNLTSKIIIRVKTDKFVVWNEIMKKEAENLYNYPAQDIFISGIPQFDIYFKKEGILSRNDFFKSIGANPQKKLLTYPTADLGTAPSDLEIIEIINEYIEKNQLIYPSQLLVRVHPGINLNNSEYRKFKNYKNIVIEEPKRPSKSFYDRWDPTREDMIHLANILFHSDVVMDTASTTTIDACVFDKPVINIAFDGYQKKLYWDSVKRYYDYTHYKNIVKTGGVKMAKNKKELLQYINQYLKNPLLDKEGRRKIVQEQCYYTDGRSGERIANFILEQLQGIQVKR